MTARTGAPVIALLASQLRADEKRLLEALERRRIGCEYADTRAFWGDPARPPHWRGVLNREIGQVRAVYAARTLESFGVPVVNSAEAVEVCGDKWRCTLALAGAGLPLPRTALGLTTEAALAALDEIGYPAVIKPLTGSWGRLIAELPDRRTAESFLEYVAERPSPQGRLAYVQELIDKPSRDIRAIVVGGELLGATYRIGPGLRTNVALGARTEACVETPEITKLAITAAGAVGADIAGVDLIEASDGRLLVLEVNHRVEFSGFQAAVGDRVDVAGRIIDHLVAMAEQW